MSFADLKRNREKMFQTLNKQIEKDNSNGNRKDERIWYPAVDQAGNGFAEIRFLPAPNDEPVPYVKIYSHGFQGTGGWYIENSLTTIGKQDFIGEENSRMWNVEDPVEQRQNRAIIRGDAKKKIQGRKRNLSYFANIYIVSDPANPENNGQVRLFRYGAKIHEKLMEAMQPDPLDPDAKVINPFDLFGPDLKAKPPQCGGANFKLKIRKNAEGFRSYEKSVFGDPAPLFDDDAQLEDVYKKAFSLQELIAPDKFKSYEDLKKQFLRAVGRQESAVNGPEASVDEPSPSGSRNSAAPKASKKAPWEEESEGMPSDKVETESDDLDYFRKIAAE